MIDFVIRSIKRVAVLIPGLAAAYLVARDVYPILDSRVPGWLAILIAYVILAYAIIPALMRVIRIFIRPKHIPLYCITADGFASDPVNVGIFGNQEQVTAAMTKIGWAPADKRTPGNIIRYGMSLLFNKPYPSAPFSNLYLFGRHQDLSFQMAIGNSPHSRHHVRFWAAEPTLTQSEQEHLAFWHKHALGKRPNRQQLWVGAASRDVGLGIIMHNAQLTHTVHPDTDAERDLIVKSLQQKGLADSLRVIRIGEAYKIRNRVFRAHLRSDGKMKIITLK